ncbi:hypothetical protein [Noviherbaspirillum sp. UKPF54]|uniref:hypothetical protein n=1 Tax=Noviherbaspirillum sp. UKPF54 TaxID=2601898 RepID=UPI0011B1AFE6|nr:hypothetical protein [Noviherbaspirillum sp. UKPF54]QDZ29641.1 hypothetical protein FAY22_17740 [Noviherbaspirillum sp. UKPF54]
MAHVRPEVYKAVLENDIKDVVFQDPLGEESRKAKRNLVASSFGAILIAALDLQVNGFLGLQTVTGSTVGASVTKGLACLLVLYFLAGYLVAAYVDYSAWKFKRERYLVAPYLELVRMLEAHFAVVGEQIENATRRLENLPFGEREMRTEMEISRAISDARGQLKEIAKNGAELHGEIQPLVQHWSDTVAKTRRLSWRFRVRFVSLWGLEILLPIGLALFAVWRTLEGVPVVLTRVAG